VYSELVARLTPEPEYPRIPCLTWKRFKIRFYCPPRLSSLHVAVLVLATLAAAEPVPVRHVEGVTFGFLVLKDLHGEILAHGELKQVVTPDDPVVMSDLQFRFRDGSFYREITKFTQKGVFRLVSDQVIEKGPAFKHDSETWVDAATGNVTAKITANGKEKTVTKHLDIPNDAANGLLFILAKNLNPSASQTVVSMVAASDKPRVVELQIVPAQEKTVHEGPLDYKAQHYVVHIKITGAAGVVAPLLGKKPSDLQLWTLKSEAPTFIEFEGQLGEDTPVWRIELAAPETGASENRK